MAVISAAILRARLPYQIPAGLWIATLVVGLAGLALKDQGLAHRVAAACFALASIALGVQLIRQGRATTGDIA
jgi:3-oxoacyl-(acyl-carrier-protein) synthase